MRARPYLSTVVLVGAVLLGTGCRRLFSMHTDGGAAGWGLSSALASLVGFEGEIDMSLAMPALAGIAGSGPGGMTIAMKLKGDKMRMAYTIPGMPAAGGSATIIDGAAKKSYTLMPATKQYLETDLDPAKRTAAAPSVPSAPTPVVSKTGRTDTVAGYSCEIVSVVQPPSLARSELCLSRGLTFLGMGVGPFSRLGGGAPWADALQGGFPLRMETFDASGTSIMKMEATRIDKTSEPDSLFEVPPGYTNVSAYAPTVGGAAGGTKGP